MPSWWPAAACWPGWDSPCCAATRRGRPQPPANPSLTPQILFAASPGTITGVITLSVAHAKSGIPVTALMAVATTMMWILIVAGSGGFVHHAVIRFMGLIVIAMGIQFALSGVRSFMLETSARLPVGVTNPVGANSEEKLSTASQRFN